MTISSNVMGRIRKAIAKVGYQINKTETIQQLLNFSISVLAEKQMESSIECIDTIVFSKDRAMQLHAFLVSYIEKVKNSGVVYVLFKASDHVHLKAYTELEKLMPKSKVVFITEDNFRKQLLEILEASKAKLVGFFVDDMIFIRDIDYNDIVKINPFKHIVSLSRGQDLDYSVVLNKDLILPKFDRYNEKLLEFRWDETSGLNDWTYPLGVSGYFYDRTEVKLLFKDIKFKAPNSLEGQMQKFLPLFNNRLGLCYSEISCVCVHANIVQTEVNNRSLGFFSIPELLDNWNDGLQIDVSKFYNSIGRNAQLQKYSFVNRNYKNL
jgi:hypothetical protein